MTDTTATLKPGTKGWQVARAMYSDEYFKEHGKRLCAEIGKWIKKSAVFNVTSYDTNWVFTTDGEAIGPILPAEFVTLTPVDEEP